MGNKPNIVNKANKATTTKANTTNKPNITHNNLLIYYAPSAGPDGRRTRANRPLVKFTRGAVVAAAVVLLVLPRVEY